MSMLSQLLIKLGLKKKKPVVSRTTQFILRGITMNAVELNVGQSVTVTVLPVKTDGTPTGGKLSNLQVSLDDGKFASSVVSGNDLIFKGLMPSQGTVNGIVEASVTDTDGYFIQDIKMQFTITVDPDPNFADRTVALDLKADV